MRITDISIKGFGVFHNLAMSDLSPGVTLFEGRNEAGKTTLMSFIRAVLFGFESRKSGNNRYEPLQGGRHGGALTLLTEDGQVYKIERYEGGVQGRMVLTGPAGRRCDVDVLQKVLHGTSKALYQNVFAFGLAELQRLDTLQADEVSHHIYTAGMGTGSVPFADVMATLEEEQGQLFKPGGKKPTINALLARLDHTQRQIRDLQAIPEDYYNLRDQILVLADEIGHLRHQLEQAKGRVHWLETVLKARPDWEQLVAIRRELGEMPRVASFPEGGVERLEQLERTLTGLDARLEDTRRSFKELEERRNSLKPDALLLQHQDSIQALAEDREHFRKLLDDLPVLRTKMDARRQTLDDVLARLGAEWNDIRLARFDASIPMRERIRGFRDQVAGLRHDVAEAAKHLEDADRLKREKEVELDRLQGSLDNLVLADPGIRPPVEEREKALRQWLQHCHQRDLISQHERDVAHLREPLEEQLRSSQEQLTRLELQRGDSLWMIITVGLLLGLLAGLAWHLNQTLLAGASVFVAILVEGYLLWRRDHLRNEWQVRRNELRRQHQGVLARVQELVQEAETTGRAIDTCTTRMATLSKLAVGHDLASPEEAEVGLRGLEAERRVVDRRMELEANIQQAEETLVKFLERRETLHRAAQAKEQEYEELQEAWSEFLTTFEVREALTPDGALEVLVSAEAAKVQLREWQDTAHALERGVEEFRSMADAINQVLERCGWTPVSMEESMGSLVALRKSLGDTLHARRECERLTDQLTERHREAEASEAERARVLEQRGALMASAEAVDGEDFRRRAVIYKRQCELELRQRQRDIALGVHAGSRERCQELEELLATKSRADLERELAEATMRERERLNESLTKKLQDKGRLEQQQQGLEQNERLSEALLEYQTFLAQLEQHTQRWAVRRITYHLLDKARQVYERERQPAVLQQASAFFQVMTDGRYQRVIVPLGQTRLEVESNDGRLQGTDRLSRGTAEQLYLSMRLALVREYAKHAGPLPLVVDDILVNFDPDRAQAAIKVLKEVSTTHQLLIFTCHPHVSKWFKDCVPHLTVRSLT